MASKNALGITGVLPEVAQRVHAASCDGTVLSPGQGIRPASLNVLWTRKCAEQSPLADHIAAVKEQLYGEETRDPSIPEEWEYHPALELRRLQNPAAQSGPFKAWSRDCAEMTKNARDLLDGIIRAREDHGGERPEKSAGVRQERNLGVRSLPVTVGEDPVGAFVEQARAGANAGRSTKSNASPCTARVWTDVMDEFGLTGIAAYPVVTMGAWWISPLEGDFNNDWRQDYLAILTYSFYFEYNVDTAPFGHPDPARLMRELIHIWNMPGLSAELQVRRSHMSCSMVFFDAKRKHEAAVKSHPTDGLTTWVHDDRDRWRDFKALDSGAYPHYVSFAEGTPGRDDMMLCGLVNDWVDIGPDLRYEECNQSVLALTRGSLILSDLLKCYERTVWMLNAQFNSEERYAGCVATFGACVWGTCNHRQDVWRYYALAFDLCAAAESLDLYMTCELADCYTAEMAAVDPAEAKTLPVLRRQLQYSVQIDGKEHVGEVALHISICDAVQDSLLPMSVVEFEFIVPLLLRRREISAQAFLAYMDRVYCENFAAVVRSAHSSCFSRAYGGAMAALVMEQWWAGMYFAIGVGSLIEAQPGHVAGDRAH